jgi:hypothetical protein
MLVAALLAITAAARWRASNPSMTSVPPRVAELRSNAPAVTDSALEEAETLAVTNDPFRLSNMPPEARFDPANEVAGSARAFTPPPVRPTFVLKAIVGGPPWQAVVNGIPGQPAGTVTRQGAQFDKLVVRSVTRDSVIIQGPDTAWVLRFGRQP